MFLCAWKKELTKATEDILDGLCKGLSGKNIQQKDTALIFTNWTESIWGVFCNKKAAFIFINLFSASHLLRYIIFDLLCFACPFVLLTERTRKPSCWACITSISIKDQVGAQVWHDRLNHWHTKHRLCSLTWPSIGQRSEQRHSGKSLWVTQAHWHHRSHTVQQAEPKYFFFYIYYFVFSFPTAFWLIISRIYAIYVTITR